MKNKDCVPVPPVECLNNGCNKRSEKCMQCHLAHCIWFYIPKKHNKKGRIDK